jgi:predicted DNA-binding transcriptional regulator AlpA
MLSKQEEAFAQGLRSRFGILTENEFAAMLGLQIETIVRWRDHKIGPAFTRLGKSIYYREADIHNWIEANIGTPFRREKQQEVAQEAAA